MDNAIYKKLLAAYADRLVRMDFDQLCIQRNAYNAIAHPLDYQKDAYQLVAAEMNKRISVGNGELDSGITLDANKRGWQPN